MLASLFRITKTRLEVGVEVSNQPIEVGMDAKSEVKIGSHLVKEGEVDPDEEAPLYLYISIELSLEIDLTPEIEGT